MAGRQRQSLRCNLGRQDDNIAGSRSEVAMIAFHSWI